MNEQNTQQIISLGDIWELFLQRLLIIVLVTAVSVGSVYAYNKVTFRPLYQSTATLYIAGDDSYTGSTSADAYNSYTLALKVVNDCDYLLASRSVVDQLIQELDLKTSYGMLQGRISTNNPTNTRILEVTVQAESPQLAKQMVNRLCEIGEEKINLAMGAKHVKLYEYGTLSGAPCNTIASSTYLIVGAVAAVLTFGLCLLLYLLDDRIRTSDQIEQVLGLTVLGDIPDTNASHRKRYGYYGRKGFYGAYVSGKTTPNKKGRA